VRAASHTKSTARQPGWRSGTDRFPITWTGGTDPERAFRRTAKSSQSIGDLLAIQRNYRVVKADMSIVLAAIVTATDDLVRWEYLVLRGRIGDRLDGGFSCTKQRYSSAKRLRPAVLCGAHPTLRRHSSKFIQSSNLFFPD
jgi:hypothetical protein